MAKMFVAKAYSIEYLAFHDGADGDEIVFEKPEAVWEPCSATTNTSTVYIFISCLYLSALIPYVCSKYTIN